MQPPRIVRWLRSFAPRRVAYSNSLEPVQPTLSQRLKAAVAERDPVLAKSVPGGDTLPREMAEWLERHFPTGEWHLVSRLLKADEIVRAYPRRNAALTAEERLNANLKELGLPVELKTSSMFFAMRLIAVLDHLVALEVERQKAGK